MNIDHSSIHKTHPKLIRELHTILFELTTDWSSLSLLKVTACVEVISSITPITIIFSERIRVNINWSDLHQDLKHSDHRTIEGLCKKFYPMVYTLYLLTLDS
jgi:hypothetical protein